MERRGEWFLNQGHAAEAGAAHAPFSLTHRLFS